MPNKYVAGIDATKPNWMALVKIHLDKGEQVLAYNLTPEQERDCMALAQEHDLACTVEDKGEMLERLKQDYSFDKQARPEFIGFVPRDPSKRIKI